MERPRPPAVDAPDEQAGGEDLAYDDTPGEEELSIDFETAEAPPVLSQGEFSEIIKRATEMELARRASESPENRFSMEDLTQAGKRLGLPQDILQRALAEMKLKRKAITITGEFRAVKKSVTAWLVSQSPSGTRLETISETEICLHFPTSISIDPLGAKVTSLQVIFDQAPEGVTVFWKADYSRLERMMYGQKLFGGISFAIALGALVLQMLSLITVGPLLGIIFGVWALVFGLLAPRSLWHQRALAEEIIANMMSSAKELQQLEAPAEGGFPSTASVGQPGKRPPRTSRTKQSSGEI